MLMFIPRGSPLCCLSLRMHVAGRAVLSSPDLRLFGAMAFLLVGFLWNSFQEVLVSLDVLVAK